MSDEFHALKRQLLDPTTLREFQWLLELAVRKYNPSNRGNRWIIGGIVEWAITLVLLEAGAIAIPDGHNADGHDLVHVLGESRALWSVKSSFSPGITEFIISNGLGGSGSGFHVPTVFTHPKLPGIVLVDPSIHHECASAAIAKAGETRMPLKAVIQHAQRNPDFVAVCTIPENPKIQTKEDPSLEAVKQILNTDIFHILNRSISQSASTDEVKQLDALERIQKMQVSGLIDLAQAQKMVSELLQ
jgi:hypothetical protein